MEALTPEQMERAASLTLFGLMIGLVLIGVVGSWLFRIAAWWNNRVNRFADTNDNIMSNDAPGEAAGIPVVPTDGRGSDAGRTEAAPGWTREQLLTHYRWLRRMGAKRDEARAQLSAMGIPLHNDLWAQRLGV